MPIANALRPQLAWTHYRALLKISGETARKWYVEEVVKGQWSIRQLERQINTHYYERLLARQKLIRFDDDDFILTLFSIHSTLKQSSHQTRTSIKISKTFSSKL